VRISWSDIGRESAALRRGLALCADSPSTCLSVDPKAALVSSRLIGLAGIVVGVPEALSVTIGGWALVAFSYRQL
jgi:hypothetical protein